jgi:ABC-type nitrate/sulfonate/bicarbonate transport system ATPase subunit
VEQTIANPVCSFSTSRSAPDALTRRDMQAFLSHIWIHDRFATLLITHDVAEAVAVADCILVLRGGRFVLDVNVPDPRRRESEDSELVALEREILAARSVVAAAVLPRTGHPSSGHRR